MLWRIEVFPKEFLPSRSLASQITDLGIKDKVEVYFKKVYFLDTDLEEYALTEIIPRVFIDPVWEKFSLSQGMFARRPEDDEITITYNPGVCDTVALSVEKAMRDISSPVRDVRTGRYYKIKGLKRKDILWVAEKLLYNPLIEHILDYDKVSSLEGLDEFGKVRYEFELQTVDVLNATDEQLVDISRKGNLSLNLDEMHIIQDYFRKKGRNPTDCELETIAQTWSEHCAHKTFRGVINYEEKDESGKTIYREKIDNLLRSTVVKATQEVNSPLCVSVFDDNSGIVRFDDKYNVCFKVETHNHPSSLEPYGGASTGIGGVIRDILGTGSAAKPVASIDVFAFSLWHIDYKDLPAGLLHPKRIIKGVVSGVRDYGNKMGIPTVAGAVVFDERFLGNPLVYCGTVGLIPRDKSFKEVREKELIVVCGAPTGRDGIHGATFSSVELTEDTVSLTSAVQIGNPLEEKKLTEAILRARDEDLFTAITDCGAGGLSSAVGELSREHGARVYLEKVPLKYEGLSYTDIWISESQERMVIFLPEENLPRLKEIFDEEEVGFAVIGEVTSDKKLSLFYEGNKVAELDMDFLHRIPSLEKKAVWIKKSEERIKLKDKEDYTDDLKLVLSSPNVAPKDWIVRQYDHEVQAQSVVRPLLGIERVGLSDAAVIRPNLRGEKCVAIGVGINPFYSDIDPYEMAGLVIDEALRNVICVGGQIDRTFILDNFSWASPNDEMVLGGLVRAAKGCYDFAVEFGVPFISGKDSLYNEYVVGRKRIAIPGTLLISALSILDSPQKTVTADLKEEGNLVYVVGYTRAEMGCSEYFRRSGIKGGILPRVRRKEAKKILSAVSLAVREGLVISCHDCSEGGLVVALAEMALAGGKGMSVFLGEVPVDATDIRDYEILFAESPSRFLVEVKKEKKEAFERVMKDVPLGLAGCVSRDSRFVIYNVSSRKIIDASLEELQEVSLSVFQDFRP